MARTAGTGSRILRTLRTLVLGAARAKLGCKTLCRSSIRVTLLVCASQLWFILPTLGVSQPAEAEHVSLELVSEQDALVPSKKLWLGVQFSLQDGWHTYWVNPGDSGEPPRIEWHLPAGFKLGAIQWPLPERLVNPPFADYGYEHEVLLMAELSPPAGLTVGQKVNIDAGIHYLVCREVCIPGKKQLHVTLPVKDRANRTSATPLFESVRQKLPRPAPAEWRLTAVEGTDELVLSLTTKDGALTAQFFPLNSEQIENAAPQKVTAKPGGIRLHLTKSKQLLKPTSRLEGVLVVGAGKAYQVNVPVSQSLGKTHPRQPKSNS